MADIARRLGKPLMPWQREVVDIAYEIDPDTGRLWYQAGGITVPRQSGKTELVKAKTVHRLTRVAHKHGPQRSLYVTQKRHKARQKLEQDFAPGLRESRAFREVAGPRARPQRIVEWRLSLNNGNEHIQFGPASYWQIDAPSRDGGHGDSLDDGTVDEAWAQRDSTVEDGIKPAMAARTLVGIGPQWWWLSTAGDATSYWMWRKMLAGRRAVADPNARVFYFEYSAADDADPGDPDTWVLCSPALGITIDIDYIAGLWDEAQREGQESIDGFRRAYLNQWPEIPILADDSSTDGPMTSEDWQNCASEKAAVNPDQPLAVTFDVAADRSWSSVSISDGDAVEITHNARGTGWIIDTLLGLRDRRQPVAIGYPPGPASALHQDLLAAGLDIRALTGAEFRQACGAFIDAVNNGRLRHRNQNELTTAALNTAVRLSDGGEIFSRSASVVDISPLTAATAARWLAVDARNGAPPINVVDSIG